MEIRGLVGILNNENRRCLAFEAVSVEITRPLVGGRSHKSILIMLLILLALILVLNVSCYGNVLGCTIMGQLLYRRRLRMILLSHLFWRLPLYLREP